MLSSFSLKKIPQIVFGAGKLAELDKLIGRLGRHPLVVVGSRSFYQSAQHRVLQDIFANLDLKAPTVNIDTEPSPEAIDQVVADPAHSDIDLVIAIGGGSVLDGGKALSAMLVEQGSVARFLEGIGTAKPSGRKLPFIAIPTTSGTGSETTSNAVLSSVGPQGFKSSLRHDNYIPDVALVDPSLTLSCPRPLTAACAMDSLTQLVEAYLSTNGSPITDLLSFDGIQTVRRSLRAAYSDGENLAARSDLAYGALLSGIVLTNAGLGTVHGFASVIGGLFAIPHGVVCGTLMAPANKTTLKRLTSNAPDHPALIKYTRLGRLFSDQKNKPDAWYRDNFIHELERLTDDLAIPKLSSYDVSRDDIGTIVAKTSNKYNPARLSEEELAQILRSRIVSSEKPPAGHI